MSEFLEFVLGELRSGLVLVLLAGILASVGVIVAYRRHKRKYGSARKFPWRQTMLWLLFAGYVIIVLYATILRWYGGYRDWNLHLFRAWREAWNNFSAKSWANVLLNIAMFVPLGVLLPLMGKPFRNWYVTIPTGFGTSALIEVVQLLLSRGVCDVDDLFCNGLGAMIGYFAFMAVGSLVGKKEMGLKPFLAYGVMALVPVMAIGSIFASYQLREYGNLPYAAAYRLDLSHLSWELDCELPESAGAVPVFRTRPMRKDECDTFASRMAALMGQEVQMVSYYQEMAYYNLSKGIMKVYYHDGSYELGWFDHELTPSVQLDRRRVEEALQAFSVTIPEEAEFRWEDGKYIFTCDEQQDGDAMLDGILQVQIGDDGALLWLRNNLVRYTYHKAVPIITAQEAYERLMDGDFCDAMAVKQDSLGRVPVRSCTLEYEIDTKGIYQSVYRFELLLPDKGYTINAMIPAMK